MSFLLMWLYVWFAAGTAAQSTAPADALLQRAAREGTPLVDQVDGNAPYALVTFLWHGTADTKNIAVVGTFLPAPLVAMTRIGDSNLWSLAAKVPAGARFDYWLAENSPMVTEGPEVGAMLAARQADPLNPHRTCAAGAPLKGCKSIVELPRASPQPWIVKNTSIPAGTVEHYSVKSERLKNERGVSVYTPARYRVSAGPAALLIVFDGSAYLSSVPVPTILDNLIAADRIPLTVAVFVDNPDQATRTRELTPNPDFPEFLVSELLPWIHMRYRVTRDPLIRRRKPDGWPRSSSEARSCPSGFTWMPARLRWTARARGAWCWRRVGTCVTCSSPRATTSITSSLWAATTISVGAERSQTDSSN